MNRREFLVNTAAGGAALGDAAHASADDAREEQKVRVTDPRATSGDDIEPQWDQRLTLTVGLHEGDIAGASEKAVQAAVDSVARWGGGTVKILPGTYRFRNAVYLQNNVRILGRGTETIIFKEPAISGKLSQDSDWFDQEITFSDPKTLQVGDGICLQVKNMATSGTDVIKRTLVARNGNRFKLDRALRQNVWLIGEPCVDTLFPLFSGEDISGVTFENLALDGNKANNGNLNGNFAGCIWLQDCNRITMRKVTARNYNGDGISWQVCHDVLVEDCNSYNHTGKGLHPGSGSQRSVIRRNRLTGNDEGLFFCWGVRWGLAEKNYLENNRSYGISIGHRDTNNVVRDNDIHFSGKVGILFRKEPAAAFAGNLNQIEGNRIISVTHENGVGIDVQGQTDSIGIENNRIRETQPPSGRIGIRIGVEAGQVKLVENRIEGFSKDLVDLRAKQS